MDHLVNCEVYILDHTSQVCPALRMVDAGLQPCMTAVCCWHVARLGGQATYHILSPIWLQITIDDCTDCKIFIGTLHACLRPACGC